MMVRDQLLYLNRLNYPDKQYIACKEGLFTINLSILLYKLSSLTTEINEQISALTSNGLIEKWAEDQIDLSDLMRLSNTVGPRKLTNEQLMGAYQILIAGFLISFLIFAAEFHSTENFKLRKVMDFLSEK